LPQVINKLVEPKTPTIGYFHVALMHGLSGIIVASEMHGRILQSGLYNATDTINVVILGDAQHAQVLNDYIFSRHKKYVVRLIDPNIALFEWPTFECIYKDAQISNHNVWYVHTKGVSNCRPDVPDRIQHNIRSWRGVMSYHIMERHKGCVELLKEYDAVGALYVEGQHYFAGNFWWSKSSHIKTLRTPAGTRNEAEGWIGTNRNSKFYSLCSFPKVKGIDLYDFDNNHGEAGVFNDMEGNT